MRCVKSNKSMMCQTTRNSTLRPISQTTNIMTTLNPTYYFHAAMIHVDYWNSKSQSYKNRFRNTQAENKPKKNVDVRHEHVLLNISAQESRFDVQLAYLPVHFRSNASIIRILCNLQTGANVLPQSCPGTWFQPWGTKRALYVIFGFIFNIHLLLMTSVLGGTADRGTTL